MHALDSEEPLTELAELVRYRHSAFEQAAFKMRLVSRDRLTEPQQVILVRYQLSLAIRRRRALVGRLSQRLILRGRREAQDTERTKAQLLSVAIPYLGRWSAKRIVDEPTRFTEETAPLFDLMMDLSAQEASYLLSIVA